MSDPSLSVSSCLAVLGLAEDDVFGMWIVSYFRTEGVHNLLELRAKGSDFFEDAMENAGEDFVEMWCPASSQVVRNERDIIFAEDSSSSAELKNFIIVARVLLGVMSPCLREIFQNKWNAKYGVHHTWSSDPVDFVSNGRVFMEGKKDDTFIEVGQVQTKKDSKSCKTGTSVISSCKIVLASC